MSHQFELRHLEYFMVVAEELHFRKASERLRISQPGLSRQIRQLEELVGTDLLIRDKRNVEMTEAGKYLYKEAQFIFNHLNFVKHHTWLRGQGLEVQLRVGFLGSAIQKVVPDLLRRMSDSFPHIQTSLEGLSNPDQIEGILRGSLDIGFVRLDQVPETLSLRPVYQDTFSLVLPKKHAVNKDTFENVGQVADENFILFPPSYSTGYYQKIVSICEAQGFKPKVSHQSVHAPTIFRLVEMGLGVAIVPTTLQHGYKMGIQFIELKDIPQKALLSVAWKERNRNPALKKALSLIDFLD
mgnify:CR=1 FL=1